MAAKRTEANCLQMVEGGLVENWSAQRALQRTGRSLNI